METTTAFDLNRAIGEWRENLSQSPAFQQENLDELESHLRDSMAMLRTHDLSEPEAFLIATRRLGGREQLSPEFGKINPAAFWLQRSIWMLAGMLFFLVGRDVIYLIRAGVLYTGSLFMENGLLLGWLVVGVSVIFFAIVMIAFWWLAHGRLAGVGKIGQQLSHQPARFAVYGIGGILLLKLASYALLRLAYTYIFNIKLLGQSQMVEAWFLLIISLLLPVIVLVGIIWLRRNQSARSSC